MIHVEYSVTDTGLIDAYAQLCRRLPDFVNTVTNRVVNQVGESSLVEFRKEPGPVKRPPRWTTPKQRRFVMMMQRKGLIPAPYVRTHALAKGWRLSVVYIPNQLSEIDLTNDKDYAVFVEGLRQQTMHADTGWLYVPDRAEKWQRFFVGEIETALIKAWYAVDEQGAY